MDKLKWKKLGQVFFFTPVDAYLQTHASNPMAVHMHDDVFRVFYSGRSNQNRSSIGYVDLNIATKEVLSTCKESVFKVNQDENCFYSHGVSIGNQYSVGSELFVLFMGWQVTKGKHWRGDIGRLKLHHKEKMTLVENKPFIGCDQEDKVSLSYPWVIFDEGVYKMWYGSTISWASENGEMIHVIKYATSKNGVDWDKHGLAIPYELGVAQAFSRPTVVKDEEGYHMWFSFRSGTGQKYRIGYAFSSNGIDWDRKQYSGIDVSEEGWDSEMICYPFVFDHKGKRYMLYNGNEFGKTGFGMAVLESE